MTGEAFALALLIAFALALVGIRQDCATAEIARCVEVR